MARTRARPTLRLLLALVAAVIPGPGGTQVSIQLSEAILPRGASLRVNCSSSCSEGLDLGLETQWSKVELEHGHNWKLFELSDIEEDSNLMCFGNCGTVQSSASATIILYSFPERVELDPLPAWQQVGKILTLRCLVDGGAPRSQLSVVFFQGEEELHQEKVGVNSTNPQEITTTVLASRDNHGANFSCRTELDLRPQGLEVFLNVSEARQLRTFDLPGTSPKLNSPDLLEVGTQQKVSCYLEGLFPASEAQLHLELGGHILTSKSTNRGDLVSATALVDVPAELEGTQQLRCVLELADQTRQAEKTLNIYSFSAPVLTLSPPEVSEGNHVMVKCEAHGGAQEVWLSGAPPGGPPSPQVNFTLNASADDDQRRFFCSAALKVAGQKLLKNQTQELRVLYGPRLDERDCPRNWTWPEGSQQTLKCKARGNPSPKLTCSRKANNAPLPPGVVVTVTREMSGIYVCQATSSRGNVTREVSLTVKISDPPINWVILVITLLIVLFVGLAIYLYNRQRKIRRYELQRAQEEAMKLKAQAPPP
ncbi:intercellular adhesion molecule 1 [Peromyscus californicus insignis]|uniref:intercellular adhesion molecule 1 n=1 Tax=Peromyscus californicus insignis TaxID=564181 RepID=UPI0022A7E0BD|nr:intercellular adhesion molecule 1 [Peromyscus californicus insignis]